MKSIRELVKDAPVLDEYIDAESRDSYLELQRMLQDAGIDYVHNHRLVRGLDYYNGVVFEWVCSHTLGAQNTVCAGGRYDKLVSFMGGAAMPATGFAAGLERIMAIMADEQAGICQATVIPGSCDPTADYRLPQAGGTVAGRYGRAQGRG